MVRTVYCIEFNVSNMLKVHKALSHTIYVENTFSFYPTERF